MIREATDHDAGKLLRLMGMAAFPPSHEVTEEDLRLPHVMRWFAPRRDSPSITLVAEAAGAVIGAIWARVVNPVLLVRDLRPIPEVAIAVDAHHRRSGIGSHILDALHDRATDEGIPWLSLAVSPTNPACALYQRHAYEVVGQMGSRLIMLRDLRT